VQGCCSPSSLTPLVRSHEHRRVKSGIIDWVAYNAFKNQILMAIRRTGIPLESLSSLNRSLAPSASEDPTKCSELAVVRYDAGSLQCEFGARFRLVESSKEHLTAFRTPCLTSWRKFSALSTGPRRFTFGEIRSSVRSPPRCRNRNLSIVVVEFAHIVRFRERLLTPGTESKFVRTH
jgi:hypothetical protein